MENSKTVVPEVEEKDTDSLESKSLENVSGGYVYREPSHPDYKYEVINDITGNVEGRYKTRGEARRAASAMGFGSESIYFSGTLKKIRDEAKKGLRHTINRPYKK